MNAATHIVSGYVFAGTLCSFAQVNVFEKPQYIAACAICSILPDIDTTKSAIGKIFYPVSWILYRKCGHRTITHSLLFLIFVWAILFLLFRLNVVPDKNFLKIAIFAIIGHFVFDMTTVSGIPLLYPFFKNPCVMPGNVNLRFKSGEWKGELIVIGICGLLCFTMQPLFAQGFWNTYNRSFATIKHVDRENKNTEFYVVCEYSYILNAETHEGEAIVIDSKNNELTLFDRRNVFKLNVDDPQLKINYTRPRISTIEKRFEDLNFFNIPYDSLQIILRGKLASGLIQSNINVRFIDDSNITYHTNYIKFANRFDFQIMANVDSTKTSISASIARLEASINQSEQRHEAELAKWHAHNRSIANLEKNLKSETLTNYERNKMQKELIKLRGQRYDKPVYIPPASQIADLEHRKKSLTQNNLMFSGHLTVYTFGYEPSSLPPLGGIEGGRKPIYNSDHMFASLNPSKSVTP
jgi:inner membrane protein